MLVFAREFPAWLPEGFVPRHVSQDPVENLFAEVRYTPSVSSRAAVITLKPNLAPPSCWTQASLANPHPGTFIHPSLKQVRALSCDTGQRGTSARRGINQRGAMPGAGTSRHTNSYSDDFGEDADPIRRSSWLVRVKRRRVERENATTYVDSDDASESQE